MAVLVLFFDGIGIGEDDAGRNPFAAIDARRLAPLAARELDDGSLFRALDATLGIPGLPQSATGQTTLLTGVNAARVLGRHQTGVPGPTLRPILERESLFLKLVQAGRRPTAAGQDGTDPPSGCGAGVQCPHERPADAAMADEGDGFHGAASASPTGSGLSSAIASMAKYEVTESSSTAEIRRW